MNKAKALKELDAINERRQAERSSGGNGEQKEFMPFVIPKDLDFGVRYRFRILPSDPVKNPDGYVTIPRVSIHTDMPIGKYGSPSKQVFTLDRTGFADQNAAPTYLENFLHKMWKHFDEVGTPQESDFKDPSVAKLFWASVNAAQTVQWRTWEYPTVWWATCTTKLVQSGGQFPKKTFINYVPSGSANPLPRVFQFTQQYLQKSLIAMDEAVRTPKSEKVTKDLSGYELNSPTTGFDLAITRKDENPYPKLYLEIFAPSDGADALDDTVMEAYGPGTDIYPDLVSRVKSVAKTDAELKDAINGSWWGKFVNENYSFSLD